MKELDAVNNLILPIIMAKLWIIVRLLHDRYEWKMEWAINYALRLCMWIITSIMSSFLISKDIYAYGVDLYWVCVFLIWLFWMEISLFLLDKKFMKQISSTLNGILFSRLNKDYE